MFMCPPFPMRLVPEGNLIRTSIFPPHCERHIACPRVVRGLNALDKQVENVLAFVLNSSDPILKPRVQTGRVLVPTIHAFGV